MTVDSFTRAVEPIHILIGRLAPKPTDQTILLVTDAEAEEYPAEARPLFEFLDVPRTNSEFINWASGVDENAQDLIDRLSKDGILLTLTPGSAARITDQTGPYVLTAEAPRDSRMKDDRLTAYHSADDRIVPISKITGTLLWQNPDRYTISQWLNAASERGADPIAFTKAIATDLPQLLRDKAASLRHKD